MTENFVPTERATAVSPRGYSAADYEVTAGGQHLGDVTVWTEGAKKLHVPGPNPTVLLVSFKIENTSDKPIEIRPEYVRIQAGDRSITPTGSEIVAGDQTTPPGGDGYVEFRFTMPEGVSPQSLDEFEIEWQARSNDLVYTQRTPFRELEYPAYAYGYPWFYDYYHWSFYDRFYFPALPFR